MLMLSRKRGEALIIKTSHGDIKIVMTEIDKRGRARIGIDAPADVIVLREELTTRTTEERDDAAHQ